MPDDRRRSPPPTTGDLTVIAPAKYADLLKIVDRTARRFTGKPARRGYVTTGGWTGFYAGLPWVIELPPVAEIDSEGD